MGINDIIVPLSLGQKARREVWDEWKYLIYTSSILTTQGGRTTHYLLVNKNIAVLYIFTDEDSSAKDWKIID